MFLKFLSNEFSKPIDDKMKNHLSYLVSAEISRKIFEKGMHGGILYPSVRIAKVGLNVALVPEVADKMQLYHVNECCVKIENGKVKISAPITSCDVPEGATKFELLPTGAPDFCKI